MFRSSRWRSEKNKIKVVFKLHFHATQVSQVVGDTLLVSVIPADIGKPTAKLEKAPVRDGSCYWEIPVYETVKFVREPKTGKIQERIYHFVLGTGSSRAGIIGEASIDLANYAEATRLSSVSLAVKNSKSGAVLHVSIQRMQDSLDQREVDESDYGKLHSKDRSLRAQLSNGDMDESINSNTVEEESPINKTVSNVGEMNGGRRASSGSDITMTSSGSSSGLDAPWDLQMKSNNIHQEPTGFLSSGNHAPAPRRATSDVSTEIYEEHQKSEWEWLRNSTLEVSTDDSSGTPRETLYRERSMEGSDIMSEKLKSDLAALARQAEVAELELQTLRKQIVKESKRGQDLSREIVGLKQERDAFREECEKLKASQRSIDEARAKNKLQSQAGDPQALLVELRQELNYEKELNENLRVQLQKTQESNSELILAVRDLDEMLEQKDREISNMSNRSKIDSATKKLHETSSKNETEEDDDEEQKALEEIVKEHSDARETYLLEQKIMDLHSEIEIYRRDKDELEMQMEQLALDYEILKQENHDMSYKLEQSQLQEQLKMQYECSTSFGAVNELEAQVDNLENQLKKQSEDFSDSLVKIGELENHVKNLEAQVDNLENQLKKQSDNFSDSLVKISELENHVKNLEEELEKQAQEFETDLEALTRAKVEQEQRAILAEETLRKARWQNAKTAERLQEEFRRLSMQMASTFEANEKLATKAFTEANQLRLEKSHVEEMLLKASEELQSAKYHYEASLRRLSDQVGSLTDQVRQMNLEIEDKNVQLENQNRHAGENHKLLSDEILKLKAEIRKLVAENQALLNQAKHEDTMIAKTEDMRNIIEEMELRIKRKDNDRKELENQVAVVKNEADDLRAALNSVQCVKDEKDSIIQNLQSQLDSLVLQCSELKQRFDEDELEKEKLRKQVVQLKGDIKKKEDALSSMEKKPKDNNSRAKASDGPKASPKGNKSPTVPQGLKEVANLKEKIKLLEGQIKLKEAALETSENSFLEKERDLQSKIEDLEEKLEVMNKNTARFCDQGPEKVDPVTEDLNPNCNPTEYDPSLNSNNGNSQENEQKDSDFDAQSNEIALLKERNKSMEIELKEMQERYSEISLKFAEVEGERQQLVMKLRNLKNAKKSS